MSGRTLADDAPQELAVDYRLLVEAVEMAKQLVDVLDLGDERLLGGLLVHLSQKTVDFCF